MDNYYEKLLYKDEISFDRDKIWFHLVDKYNKQTHDYIKEIEEDFSKISVEEYDKKLQFWVDKGLSPFKLQYIFTLKENIKPVISIYPVNNDERKMYLNFLIDWTYNEYSSNKTDYQFETIPFENLKTHFFNIKENKEEKILNEINTTKRRIKKTKVNSDIYAYITYKEREPNMLSDLEIDNKDMGISLQYFAIEVSFVLDFLKYLLFLNQQRITDNTIIGYIPPKDKSFKTIYKEDKLKQIHS